MNSLTELHWINHTLSWRSNGAPRKVEFGRKISSALLLKSDGVAVIEGDDWKNCAYLLNSDGSLRSVLQNPFGINQRMIFYYFNYEGDNLVVILAGATGDFACKVDETTGEVSLPRETR